MSSLDRGVGSRGAPGAGGHRVLVPPPLFTDFCSLCIASVCVHVCGDSVSLFYTSLVV